MEKEVDMNEKCQAVMILAAVGDIVGYKNGKWEFCFNSQEIQDEFDVLTDKQGMKNLKLSPKWIYSDDTAMHIATAQTLCSSTTVDLNLYQTMASNYKKSMHNMQNRAPGITTKDQMSKLSVNNPFKLKFNPRGGGCGVSMRSACIGLAYHNEQDIDKLIEVAIEGGRMSHNHPTGYLGGVVSAYFVALAVRKIQPSLWIAYFLALRSRIEQYITKANRDVDENIKAMNAYFERFHYFVKERQLSTDINDMKQAQFGPNYGKCQEQYQFYKSLGFEGMKGWPGANGCDSVLIAYDALLACKNDWDDLCRRAMLHGGDNDSTGTIAGAWYGAINGYNGVPQVNYQNIEGKQQLIELGERIYQKYYEQ